MGRSLKKGPFVNAKLLRTIEEMNAANDKKVVKTRKKKKASDKYIVKRRNEK